MNIWRTWVALLSLLMTATVVRAQTEPDSTRRTVVDTSQRMSFTPIRQPAAEVCDTVVLVVRDTVWMECIDPNDSIITVEREPTRYDKRVRCYRKGWDMLIPTHAKLQYAGNMGLISVGVGWEYGKRGQWETEILFGYLPKYDSDRNKVTMTLKENYIPWSIQLREKPVSIEPLMCGLYLNTVFGNEFWVSEPDRFPSGYYGFSLRIRIHVFLGQMVTLTIPEHKRWNARNVSLFYEVSTCDLYIVSAFTNKYLKPRDYLCLSLGLRMQLL